MSRKKQPTPLYPPDTEEELIRCPECGHAGSLDNDFDGMGAEVGNVFCNQKGCACEFDPATGAVWIKNLLWPEP